MLEWLCFAKVRIAPQSAVSPFLVIGTALVPLKRRMRAPESTEMVAGCLRRRPLGVLLQHRCGLFVLSAALLLGGCANAYLIGAVDGTIELGMRKTGQNARRCYQSVKVENVYRFGESDVLSFGFPSAHARHPGETACAFSPSSGRSALFPGTIVSTGYPFMLPCLLAPHFACESLKERNPFLRDDSRGCRSFLSRFSLASRGLCRFL